MAKYPALSVSVSSFPSESRITGTTPNMGSVAAPGFIGVAPGRPCTGPDVRDTYAIRARDTRAAAQRRRMCHISESIAVLVSSSATHWSLLPNYRHMYHIAQSITVTIKPRVSVNVRVRVSLALSYEAYTHTAKGISLSLPLVSLSLCLSVCLSVPAPVAILSLSLSAHEQTPLYLCTCILCIP